MMLFRLIKCRDPNRELWFKLNDVDIRFSLVEFAFVIGLVFKYDTKVSNYVDCSGRPRLKEEYFSCVNRSLHYIDIQRLDED